MGIEDYEKRDLSAYSVLIVDDIALNALLLQKGLSKLNLKISVATSGQAALNAVAVSKPSIILLDIMMPGIDGLTFLKKLREDPSNDAIRVVMVTAINANDQIVKALQLGANDYITKPIKLDKLYSSIITQLNAYKTLV